MYGSIIIYVAGDDVKFLTGLSTWPLPLALLLWLLLLLLSDGSSSCTNHDDYR
jgi:hypothetical protein